jgi:hypothetical protein
MSSTLSPTQSEFSAGLSPPKRSADTALRPANPKSDQFPSRRPSLGRRVSGALARFLIIFSIGVAATLAWQSCGDAAREMIARSSPQLGWLAVPAAPIAQTAPDIIASAEPVTPSPGLRAMSLSLAAVRQSVDQLVAQFAAGHEQMTREITKLEAAEQEILQKISAPPPRPAEAPARKPVPLAPSQAPSAR